MVYGMQLIEAIRQERSDPPSGIRTLSLDRTHRWLTDLRPGFARFVWPYEDAYNNLEGAVICSWIAALADQAIFFAANTICANGETTRMQDLRTVYLQNITAGSVAFAAEVRCRIEDKVYCVCSISDHHGSLAAEASAVLRIVR